MNFRFYDKYRHIVEYSFSGAVDALVISTRRMYFNLMKNSFLRNFEFCIVFYLYKINVELCAFTINELSYFENMKCYMELLKCCFQEMSFKKGRVKLIK